MLPHSRCHRPAWPGDPVRRALSVWSAPPLEYWIARSSRAMTTMC